MKEIAWLVIIGAIAGVVYAFIRLRAQIAERKRASEARFASLMAQALPAGAAAKSAPEPAAPAPASPPPAMDANEKLLFEAASKAGQAGEAALSIQLYARLLARYPGTAFADPARAAVALQKAKVSPKA